MRKGGGCGDELAFEVGRVVGETRARGQLRQRRDARTEDAGQTQRTGAGNGAALRDDEKR